MFYLSFLCPQAEFECINSKKKQKKKGYKNSGVVSVKTCQVGCSCSSGVFNCPSSGQDYQTCFHWHRW